MYYYVESPKIHVLLFWDYKTHILPCSEYQNTYIYYYAESPKTQLLLCWEQGWAIALSLLRSFALSLLVLLLFSKRAKDWFALCCTFQKERKSGLLFFALFNRVKERIALFRSFRKEWKSKLLFFKIIKRANPTLSLFWKERKSERAKERKSERAKERKINCPTLL